MHVRLMYVAEGLRTIYKVQSGLSKVVKFRVFSTGEAMYVLLYDPQSCAQKLFLQTAKLLWPTMHPRKHIEPLADWGHACEPHDPNLRF